MSRDDLLKICNSSLPGADYVLLTPFFRRIYKLQAIFIVVKDCIFINQITVLYKIFNYQTMLITDTDHI